MSIAPVSSFPPDRNESPANQSGDSEQPKGTVATGTSRLAPPVSAPSPKQEVSAAAKVSSSYELPEDVVEVHQDPDIKSQIIIQYLDKAKDVVLQVPSRQELDVERGIAQEFQQAAKQRATENTAIASEPGKSHGD